MDSANATVVYLLEYMGPRIGEALVLRCGDVDLSRNQLNVLRAQSVNANLHLAETVPKGNRTRFIPIPSQLLPMVKTLLEGPDTKNYRLFGPRGDRQTSSTGGTVYGRLPCVKPACRIFKNWSFVLCATPPPSSDQGRCGHRDPAGSPGPRLCHWDSGHLRWSLTEVIVQDIRIWQWKFAHSCDHTGKQSGSCIFKISRRYFCSKVSRRTVFCEFVDTSDFCNDYAIMRASLTFYAYS